MTQPQFDRTRHGSLWDRGSADSYYGRPPTPHWYPNGTYNGAAVTQLSAEEIAEYMMGYADNEESGGKKNY